MDDAERMALIEEAVAPVVDAHGLELIDLEWRGLRPRGVLRLYVDKAGGGGPLAPQGVESQRVKDSMNRELITVIEQIGREKGIDKEILFEALESALLSASRKTLGASDNWRMHIDRKSGDLRVYCRKKVVTEVADDKQEISLTDAKALNTDAELDDELELEQ